MRKDQRKRPFYRRPWLWIIVTVMLISGGLIIVNRSQTTKVQDDTAVKTTKQVRKKVSKNKKKAKKDATAEEKDRGQTNHNAASATRPNQNNVVVNGSYGSGQSNVPVTDNNNDVQEPWVDPDNYEPNSIIGDRSTMYCYLPGQYPDPGIAPENVVYFNSLAEAQAAGYHTVQ